MRAGREPVATPVRGGEERRIGPVRAAGDSDGITRAQAERMFRKVQADEATISRAKAKRKRAVTVDFAADTLRERLAIEGARLSYRQNTESMQRIHISPALGKRRIETVTRQDVERLARSMLASGQAPKTVRNVMTFQHAVFALALGRARPGRRRRPPEASPPERREP